MHRDSTRSESALLPSLPVSGALPAVEATAVVGRVWPRAARRQRLCGRGGACRCGDGAAVVERKDSGRRGGEEGGREM